MRKNYKSNLHIVPLLNETPLSPELVGGKGYNLAKLKDVKGIVTKPGFIITSNAYAQYVGDEIRPLLARLKAVEGRHNLEKMETITLLEDIKSKILQINLSSLLDQLASLDSEKYYAVRSSGTAEDGSKASFSGKFYTQLYVNKNNIIEEIKKVWASVFTLNNLEYCQVNSIDFTKIHMAVVIQEISHPIIAGTVFTDPNKTAIDVAPGLGDAVVKGNKPIDRVVLDSLTQHVIFTEVSKKQTKLAYNKEHDKIIEVDLSQHEAESLCITSLQIQKLSEQVILLKKAYPECNNGLDIEFSCDADGHIYILQVRPVTIPIIDGIQQVDDEKSKSYFIGKGNPVSFHVRSGILAVCNTPSDAEKAILDAQRKQKKVIIVTANTTSQWESVMRRSVGVIAEMGSTNCHTAIACREMCISGITEYQGAMEHLKHYDGQVITLCGPSGKVYRGDRTAYLSSGELKTDYTPIETEAITPRKKHLAQAKSAHMILVHNKENYIGKPVTPTCSLISALDLAAHRWVEKRLTLKKATYHITADNILLMSFYDCHQWRIAIRKWTIRNHQTVLILRKKSEKEFLEASHSLELTENSMQRWFAAYEQKIGFDNIAFPIGEILNGVLHQAAKEKGIKEPMLSDLILAEVSCMGHFKLQKCHDELRQIQSSLLEDTEAFDLVQKLEGIYSDSKDVGHSVIIKYEARLIECLKSSGLYAKCKEIATSYRIQEKDFSLTFLEPWFQQSSTPWLRLLIESKKLTGPAPQPLSTRKKCYYPEDKIFREIIELVASSKKLHMDGHHTKAQGLWQFIGIMHKLSENTGYPISKLLSQPQDEIIKIVRKIDSQTQPGLNPREISEYQKEQLQKLECSKKPLDSSQIKEIASFCDTLPSSDSLEKDGFVRTNSRILFSSNNDGLSKQLEDYEDQMSDRQEVLPKHKYRGEYVRPNRQDYTQHQVAMPDGCVVTMVDLTQGKPALNLLDSLQIGKPTAYSSPFKWENPAFLLSPDNELHSEHYDKITRYSKIIDKRIPGFSKKSILERISILNKLKTDPENKVQFFKVSLNTNSPAKELSTSGIIDILLNELNQEQHKLAMTGKMASILYGKDGAAPKMQSVVRIPAKDQHETFLENTLYFINKWRSPTDEECLFKMSKPDLQKFLDDSKITLKDQEIFFHSLTAARKFREYQRKPKLSADLDNGVAVEVTMNDSVDIPSQALMLITNGTNVIETNRPVSLAAGYRALNALLKNKYSGRRQNIIFSKLAYTQASSTQSMRHFHLVPVYNSEGQFMIPYLDSREKQFGKLESTNIAGVQASYLNEDAEKNYFNLVKFKIDLSTDETSNLQIFESLNQRLQLWETQTGCDMTWVARFNSKTNSATICVELRAGINQFTQDQIDTYRGKDLWGKIGFSEVMGKKYSMLSQSNLDNAANIYKNHAKLREKMLATPLYCLQISPDDAKTFYQFQDHEIKSDKLDKQEIKAVIHISRLLQVYDAKTYTKAMAALYHLHPEEMNAFKSLLSPTLNLAQSKNTNMEECNTSVATTSFTV